VGVGVVAVAGSVVEAGVASEALVAVEASAEAAGARVGDSASCLDSLFPIPDSR